MSHTEKEDYKITAIHSCDGPVVSPNRRRKFTWDHETADDTKDVDDEGYTQFEKSIADRGLNSSFKWDFEESLVESTSSTTTVSESLNCCEKSAKVDQTITKQPSLTSKGFENTFKLLKSHVEKKNSKAVQVLQTIHENGSFSLMSLQSDSDSSATPDRLQLEVKVLQRLRTVQSDTGLMSKKDLKPASLPLLYEFVAKVLPEDLAPIAEKLDVKPADNSGSKSEIVYHAARSPDGCNYLKIVNTSPPNEVLCGNRVSQMTRAYDDIEAVTRLLEEKEKDLELTVQIGKELLTQNNTLEQRIAELDSDLKTSNDDRAQLLHELHKKNELIAVLTDAEEGSEGETPTLSKSITFDLLQKKVTGLQDENRTLKQEVSQLACETDAVEEHERQLMADIAGQLNNANSQFDHVSLELERQREENRLQHEQIVSLTARLAESDMRLHKVTHDYDENSTMLSITLENQGSLALELVEFKQRYQEVLALLADAQEQIRRQCKKSMPQARSALMSSSVAATLPAPDSLQSELMEFSLYSDNSLDSGICADNYQRLKRLGVSGICSGVTMTGADGGGVGGPSGLGIGGGTEPPYKRVFETVRCATKNPYYAEGGCGMAVSQLGTMSMSSSTGPRMSASAYNPHPAGSYYRPSVSDGAAGGPSLSMGVRSMSSESLASQPDDSYPSQPQYGVPGAPGAKDLEAALKRLSPAEVLARRAMLGYAPVGIYSYDDPQPTAALPLGLRTPDSIMSTGSSGLLSSATNISSLHHWRLPDKLQIVKPIEGSQTLHHWSRLATPTLSGLLEERPGVTIRGGRGLEELGMHVYTLSDVEEDVCDEQPPGKQFEASGCTYTYTTSVVMHPDDGFVNDLSFLSHSQVSSRMASTSTSRQPSCPPTPRGGLSRKNSCSTFSVNLGLASMLSERGIKAVTPSVFNTPTGANFSPTVTPCNSPEGSPPRSMSPEPLFGLLSWGGDLIRRRLVGGEMERPQRRQQQQQKRQQQQQQQRQQVLLTRLERRALRSLKLVERVESIGLENIIAQPGGGVPAMTSGIANRSSSPMAQLTSLKHMHSNANNSGSSGGGSMNSLIDDVHFDREQIRAVLHRGLQTSTPHPQAAVSATSSQSSSAYNSDNETIMNTASARTLQNAQSAAEKRTTETTVATAALAAQPAIALANTAANATDAARARQMQRQKSRRNLKNGLAAQRPDLGTIGGVGRVRTDLGRVAPQSNELSGKSRTLDADTTSDSGEREAQPAQSMTQAFVGSVSSLLFGRKGGWL